MFATAKARAVVPFLLLAWSCGSFAEDNLLRNPGFEEDLAGSWSCSNSRCVLDVSDDSYSGQRSVHVHTRTSNGWGVEQRVEGIKAGGLYILSAHFKLLTSLADHAMLELTVTLIGSGQSRVVFAKQPYIRPCDGWVKVTTDIVTNSDTNAMIVSMATNAMEPEFLVDDAALTELVPDPLWREKANERIAQIRMGTIEISTKIRGRQSSEGLRMVLNQTSAAFPFGAAVASSRVTGISPSDRNYQDYVFHRSFFNWATISNQVKYRFMESVEGQPQIEAVNRTLATLVANNLKVRGHCITWGKTDKIKEWMRAKDPAGIREAVFRRIGYLAENYKGRFVQWDVNNEQLHGDWYEQNTGNYQFTHDMFREMHRLDPDVTLALNDYNVVGNTVYNSAYQRQAAQMVAAGVPISLMGVQGHLSIWPNVHLHKRRLDHLATAGVPLFITELDVREGDVSRRAEGYDDVITLYASHPAVEGIVMWSFWDGAGLANAAIVEGDDFQENEAGLRIRDIIMNRMRTHVTVPLDTHGKTLSNLHVRAFYGDYNYTVMDGNEIVDSGTFTLEKGRRRKLHIIVD